MLLEELMLQASVNLLGEMDMEEMKRRNDKMLFITKIIIGICSLCIVLSMQIVPFSQLSFDSNLFQSAVYSLLIFSFWIVAGCILRKPRNDSIEIHSSATITQ
jgi:hypothetical protein